VKRYGGVRRQKETGGVREISRAKKVFCSFSYKYSTMISTSPPNDSTSLWGWATLIWTSEWRNKVFNTH
jgi:hypothetical protein